MVESFFIFYKCHYVTLDGVHFDIPNAPIQESSTDNVPERSEHVERITLH